MSAPSIPIIEIHPWAFPNSLRFAWAPPSTNTVSSYNLVCSSINFNKSYNSSTFGILVSSLTNNEDHTFQIASENIYGKSPYATFLIVRPGAPSLGATNIEASTINSTIANVSWSYSTNAGECEARYFAVSAIPSTQSNSTYVLIAYPNQSSFQIPNLDPTQTYTFLVQAVTDAAWAYPFSYSISNPLTMNPGQVTVAGLLIHLNASTYSGSGIWYDSSTNGKNATLENGVIAKNSQGNGIVLNGSTNWIFPNVAAGNAWTLGVWYMNTGAFSGQACIVTQVFTSTSINLLLGLGTGQLTGGFFSAGFKAGSVINLTLNVWTNIQVTWDGTSIKTYINGSLLGTTKPIGVSIDAGNNYRIGRRWDTAQYVTGVIGSVKIYNRALTQEEVTQDYTTTQSLF